MDEQAIRQWAQTAGLTLALEMFPSDVKAAADQVARQRQALQGSLAPSEEPWPPMRVPER